MREKGVRLDTFEGASRRAAVPVFRLCNWRYWQCLRSSLVVMRWREGFFSSVLTGCCVGLALRRSGVFRFSGAVWVIAWLKCADDCLGGSCCSF